MYTILKQGYENVVEQCNDIVVECTNDLEKSKPDSEKLQKSLQKLENKYEVQANKLDSTIKQHCDVSLFFKNIIPQLLIFIFYFLKIIGH
jgi:DNA repair ATPase RecN